jgi:putative hydrolase
MPYKGLNSRHFWPSYWELKKQANPSRLRIQSMKKIALKNIQDISPSNIPRVDFHLHTSWTDGIHSPSEMYQCSVKNKLKAVLFSEHARKTSDTWFPQFTDEIRSLPNEGCQALVGVETKVTDFDGNIDCNQKIISLCDLVMASVHRFPGEKGKVREFDEVIRREAVDTEFRLACAILQNPDVDILAHPFGMCYRRFHIAPPEENVLALIKLSAKTQVALEINSHYLPNPWHFIELCKEFGAPMSLGSNAHNVDEVGQVIRVLEGTESTWKPCEF